jgi:transcriptional regulator with XRE-family HTH domain
MTVNSYDIRNISGIVKSLRKSSGLTQKELANMAGVGKTLVFEIEHGGTKVSLANLLKILKVLNTKVTLTPPIPVKVDIDK